MAKKKSFFNSKVAYLYYCLFILLIAGFFIFLFLKKSSLPVSFSEISLPEPAPYPVNFTEELPPFLTAKSAVIIDADSGTVLLEKESQAATSPASTTKIMTALVVLENFQLDQVIQIGDLGLVEGQKMKLVSGEKITVENLLYGLLVSSANDAAIAFAKSFPNGEAGFIWAMNQKAKELGLLRTNFSNPVGYDGVDHYSTARDLANLAIVAMKNPQIAKMVATEKITLSDVSGQIFHPMSNINSLIGKLAGVKGVKTGWTEEAGECLVTLVERNNRRVVITILGSEDRFTETTALVEWVFNNFSWEKFTR